jgi:SAM-dependent methyltransferase
MTDVERRLREHYDGAWEWEPGEARLIKPTRYPIDRYEACIKYFPELFQGGRILEVGAGTGHIARTLLASELPISGYTVTDFSDVSLGRLRKALAGDPRAELRRLNVESIPEGQADRYDALLMIHLIEHCIDPISVMRKIRGLLNPGGFVYVDTPNIARYTKRVQLLAGRFPSTASRNEGLTTRTGRPVDMHEEGHLHYFTFRSLSLMLTERCGFSSVRKLPYFGGRQFLPKPIGDWLARVWPAMFSELAIAAFV